MKEDIPRESGPQLADSCLLLSSPTYHSPSSTLKSRSQPWSIGSIPGFCLLHVVVLPRTHSHPYCAMSCLFPLPDTFTPSNLNPLRFACALPTLHCSASKAPLDFFFVCKICCTSFGNSLPPPVPLLHSSCLAGQPMPYWIQTDPFSGPV